MATKRLTKYEKALNRALRLQGRAMANPNLTQAQLDRVDEAWHQVVYAHWTPDHDASTCPWCERWPSLFD